MVAVVHSHMSQASANVSNVIVERQKASTIPVTNLSWVEAKPGVLPKQAIAAISVNGKSIYICNTSYLNGVHPGQLTNKGCLITYNGKSLLHKQYKVLTGTAPLVWKDRNVMYQNDYRSQQRFYGVLGKGLRVHAVRQSAPVIGGYESSYPNYPHPLYICRALGTDTVHVGKVVGYNCNVAINGKEVLESSFQVLSTEVSVPMTTTQSSRQRSRALLFD